MIQDLDEGQDTRGQELAEKSSPHTVTDTPVNAKAIAELAAADQAAAEAREEANGSITGAASSRGLGVRKFLGSASGGGKPGLLKKAGMITLFSGLGFFFIGIIIAIFLFLLGFKLDHIKNLFIDYQFAGFHRSLSMRIDHIVTTEAILSAESPGKLPAVGKSSLYDRLRGYDANSALKTLGKDGFKLDFEKGSILGKKGQLRAFEDSKTGKKYWRKDFAPAKLEPNALVLDDKQFREKIKTSIDSHLFNESNFFRRRTVSDVYERTGIKLTAFKTLIEKAKEKLTVDEKRKAVVTDELAASQPITTNSGELQSAADNAKAEALKGAPQTINPGQIPEQFSKLATLGKFSQFAFFTTMYCIFNDIYNSIPQALSSRINNSLSLAVGEATMADQQREGKAPLDGINVVAQQYDGFEKTAAYDRVQGRPVTHPDLDPSDYPTTVMGAKPQDVGKYLDAFGAVIHGPLCVFPGIKTACTELTNQACSYILNPYAQGSLAALETGLTIFTFGTDEAGIQIVARSFTKIAPDVLKLAAGVGLSEYVFGHLIPGMIQDISGVGGAGLTNATDRTNRLGAAFTLFASETASTSGAVPISNDQASHQITEARAIQIDDAKSKGPLYALFNLNNPYSTASTALATIPVTPKVAFANLNASLATIFNPGQLLSLFTGSMGNVAYASAHPSGDTAFYGIQQYGWDDSVMNGENEAYNFINNQAYIEGGQTVINGENHDLTWYKSHYGKCMGAKADVRILGKNTADPSDDFDYSTCDGLSRTPDYMHYGVYVLDCFSVEQLVSTGNTQDTFHQSDCSSLIGVTDGVGTTTGNTDAATNSSLYILGDSVSVRGKAGGLEAKFTTQGYTSVTINADVGRSIDGPGQVTKQSAIQAIDTDAQAITAAGKIMIELGTNGGDSESNITALINKIKGLNSNAKIFWVNIGAMGYTNKRPGSINAYNAANTTLARLSGTLGYQVIDWCSSVFTGSPCVITSNPKAGVLDSDGVHPSIPAGVTIFNSVVVSSVGPPLATTTSGTYRLPVDHYYLSGRFGDKGIHWGSGYHTGLDFVVPNGTPLYAVADGILKDDNNGSPYGTQTELFLPDGTGFLYCHQSARVAGFHPGMAVKAGDLIGYSGDTGNVTGPHLHFEYGPKGLFYLSASDPLTWFSAVNVNVPDKQ